MRLTAIAVGAVLAAATIAGCSSTDVHPDAFLQSVHNDVQPTRPLTDEALVGYAEDICDQVGDPFDYIDAAAATYPGLNFGDGSALVDSAILEYCPEVGDKVLDENGEFQMG